LLAPPAMLVLLASTALPARAQGGAGGQAPGDEAGLWMLMLSALTDEDGYEHALASFHLGATDRTWVSLTAGRSRAPSTEAEVRADLVAAGIEHDFGPIGLGLTAERWGDADNLESRDWEGEIFLGDEDYRLALTLERRAIDVYFSGAGAPVPTDLRRRRVDADGFGLSGRLRVAPDWQIYGAWMDYDYPPGIRVVPRADRLGLLGTSAVTLALSFVDRYASFGVERAFGQKLLNVDLTRDRSVIDGTRLTSLSASMLWPLALRMDLELRLGTSRAEGFGSALYGGLTLLIYGGG